jgi:hypothetical protein
VILGESIAKYSHLHRNKDSSKTEFNRSMRGGRAKIPESLKVSLFLSLSLSLSLSFVPSLFSFSNNTVETPC